MFISTIIPTIGRPTLARAVNSVLNQEFQQEECEVIVVNDSGKDLHVEEWQQHSKVQIVSTNRLNRSIARNTGAAIATGRYLHFLDDDDWMLPDAFQSFWVGAQNRSAAWIHGGFAMMDNNGNKLVDVYPDESGNCLINLLAWEWLPLQASIIDANAFFKIGGFVMLETLKGGFEDIHLSRQIAHQYEFQNLSKLVACIRSGDNESTTNYKDMFIQNRQSREIILDMPRSYQSLMSSARNNKMRQGYWHGKLIYYLLGSFYNNLKAQRFIRAISRLVHTPLVMLLSGKYLLQRNFWHGLTKPHYPRVWLTIKDSGKELFQNTQWNLN